MNKNDIVDEDGNNSYSESIGPIHRRRGTAVALTTRSRLSNRPMASRTSYNGTAQKQDFEEISCVSDLGRLRNMHRLTLSPALDSPPQIKLFDEANLPSTIVDEHYRVSCPPPIHVYGLPDHEVGGFGFVHREGKVFSSNDTLPSYFLSRLGESAHTLYDQWCGSTFDPDANVLEIDVPVAVPLHPNLVYGHFLLEILPKLHLLSRLRYSGVDFLVAVPNQVPEWTKRIVSLYFHESHIIHYDARTERLRSSCLILPSMMHTNYNFHPDFNLLISELTSFIGMQTSSLTKNDLVWFSRGRLSGSGQGNWRGILNQQEVENTVKNLGFSVIHPQELSFPEQISLMANAKCVGGEYGSAIHNSMFAPRGTKVFCINRINWYQSGIGKVRSQPLAYLAPADGLFRDWKSQGNKEDILVDCNLLRDQLKRFSGHMPKDLGS